MRVVTLSYWKPLIPWWVGRYKHNTVDCSLTLYAFNTSRHIRSYVAAIAVT